MKTSKEIMRREWHFPSYPYRAIDKDGEDVYYEHKPAHSGTWWVPLPGGFLEALGGTGSWIDKDWASINWKKSLQSFEEYQKLINNENDNSN
jgi:hypothetical protein